MKLRKLLSITLALLLVVSLLPTSALAKDINTDLDTVASGVTFENNNATVTTNDGTIVTNNGIIETNNGTVGSYVDPVNKEPDTDTGNKGGIAGNTGTVIVNDGEIGVNGAAGYDENYHDAQLNEDATVVRNTGNIPVNLGQVITNAEGGYIESNDGHVGTNEEGAEVVSNCGTIDANSGFVDYNEDTQYDYKDGECVEKDIPAVVDNNSGTVDRNWGAVTNIDGGTVNQNDGTVINGKGGEVKENYGLVENAAGGEVKENYGLVENEAGGEVKENYGLVENEAGGLLNDMIVTENPGNEEDPYEFTYQQFTGKEGTYVGTSIEQGYIETTDETTGEKKSADFEEGGIVGVLKQAVLGTVLNLKEVGKLFQKDGYEVIGYSTGAAAEMALSEDEVEMESAVVYETKYTVKEANSWLSLIWKAITKPSGGSDGGAEPTSSGNTGRISPPVLSSLSADKVSVGTLIRCGNVIFKIIEVNDDSIRVATVGTLSKRNQEDMMGYLKQYLSAAQIAKFIGEPELLEEELVAQFFKDNGAHIAFYAAKDLFEG